MVTRWWGKAACWLAGRHNLLDVELPAGWTVQACRTCGLPVQVFGRGGSQRYQEQRKPAAEEIPMQGVNPDADPRDSEGRAPQ